MLCVVMCVATAVSRYHSKAECMHPIAILLDICVTNNGCKLCPIYKLITWKKVFQVINLEGYLPTSFPQYVFHEFRCRNLPSY